MARGIDHVVHAVRDLDAAAALYRALGFQVGARNRIAPSWGTQNHIVQLAGTLRRIAHGRGRRRTSRRMARGISRSARFNRDALARGEGLSMLVLEGRDAQADAQAFRGAGIGDFDVFDFEREGKRPDGTPIKVAFSLAFAQRSTARRTSASSPAGTAFRRISGIRRFRFISTPPTGIAGVVHGRRRSRPTTIVS